MQNFQIYWQFSFDTLDAEEGSGLCTLVLFSDLLSKLTLDEVLFASCSAWTVDAKEFVAEGTDTCVSVSFEV